MDARLRVAAHCASRWRAWRDAHPDIWVGLKQGALIGALASALALPALHVLRRTASPSAPVVAAFVPAAPAATPLAHAPRPTAADFQATQPSPQARTIADWVAASADNQRLPFAILDKVGARVYVFDAQARLLGASMVLLGSATGDDTPPGVGDKKLSEILAHERITPAGRFVSEPGRDDEGNDVVWVDYDAAVAMHRVQVIDPKEKRFERIATPYAHDKRISNGCINVPIAFYDAVVKPAMGRSRAVVYILPDVKPLEQVFPAAGRRNAGTQTAAL